jgi:hypothetical protein
MCVLPRFIETEYRVTLARKSLACAHESPALPSEPPTGSPIGSPAGDLRRPDREAQRRFRVPRRARPEPGAGLGIVRLFQRRGNLPETLPKWARTPRKRGGSRSGDGSRLRVSEDGDHGREGEPHSSGNPALRRPSIMRAWSSGRLQGARSLTLEVERSRGDGDRLLQRLPRFINLAELA